MTGSVVVVDGGLTAGYRASDWEAVAGGVDPRPVKRLEGA